MNLFIVGQFLRNTPEAAGWNFLGVFDTKDEAEATCKDEYSFVAPAVLNRPAPTEFQWKGLYYPKKTQR